MHERSFVKSVDQQAVRNPSRVAFRNSAGECITYGELYARSNTLAHWLRASDKIVDGMPIVLYGHKSPYMLVAMLACAKAGHAYVPIDVVYPAGRVANIVEQIGDTVVLATTSEVALSLSVPVVSLSELQDICASDQDDAQDLPGLGPDDTFYILFTSGSTGVPKGVEMPSCFVDYFSQWLCDDYREPIPQAERDEGLVWFNRSPFTFDLSTDDLFCGLVEGDTVFALETEAEQSFKATFAALAASGVTDWISTPSFVDSCLVDESFCATLLPKLRRVMLAGETLRKDTVRNLQQRFPGIAVYNNYGPTETGTVTLCKITDAMMEDERSLPIGYVGPQTDALILDPQTLEPVDKGCAGELVIVGDVVAKGYWGREDLTRRGFHACPEELTNGRRSYRTGDECVLEDDGLLYYHGRLDDMIKLHGYRVELGEIESVFSSLPQVDMVCVLPVRKDDGTVSRLVAVVQPSAECVERGLKLTRQLKAAVHDVLPSYMIPSNIKAVDKIELNANGKADRKALAVLLGI
jgi:D-alanine--poly(phosphoribitol) ligase subunit 1